MPFDARKPFQLLSDEESERTFDPSKPFNILERESPDSGYITDKLKRAGRSLAQVPGQIVESVGALADVAGRIARTAGQDEYQREKGATADERIGAIRDAMQTPTPIARQVKEQGREWAKQGRDLYDTEQRFKPDPRRDEELTAQAADSTGSLAGAMLAPGRVLAKTVTGALLNSQGQAEEARRAMEQRGATPEDAEQEALTQFVLNLPAGGLEAIPWAGAIKRFGGKKLSEAIAEKYGKDALRRITGAVLGQAASEGGEEALQQVWGNAAAAAGYDPQRKLTQGTGNAFAVGALMGGGLGGTLQGAAEVAGKLAPLDTGKNVPESAATLAAQQQQLVAGRKPAQMFPLGTEELALPKGMQRVETPRGVFHFNPQLTSADEILSASAKGRENEVLGLGPISKDDAAARAAKGDPLVSVTERTPEGTEVRTSVATEGTAPTVAAELERSKTPGSTVQTEPIERVPTERAGGRGLLADLTAADDAAAERTRAEQQAETERRAAAQADADAKKAAFDERIAAARQFAADPAATFAQLDGARQSIAFYAEDNSLGLTQPQRETAARAVAALESRVAPLRAAEETRKDAERQAATERALAEEAKQKAARKAEAEALKQAKAEGIGADGNFDYATAPLPALEQRAAAGDERAIEQIMRREASEGLDRGPDLLAVLREVKLPTNDAALSGELTQLLNEGMTPAQRLALTKSKSSGLDATAEALRERGFASVQTPADVIDLVQRALRGEKIYAEQPSGEAQVEFASYQDTMDLGGTPLGLSLPAEIRNLAPRWQGKTLNFESSLDKALYYAGGTNSETRESIVASVAEQTGLTPGQIATLARQLREQIAPLARATAADASLRVPPQMNRAVSALTNADFATAQRTGSLSDQDAEREIAAIRRAFPELTRDYDLELGDVESALRARDYTGPVPATVEAAVLRMKGKRALIVLAARAYRNRTKGAGLLAHEVAHSYWHTLPEETRAMLREIHRRETKEKTGPLYRGGKLQSELAHIEEQSERGAQEWFAERIARLNEQWARGRIDRSEQPLLLRLASELRELLQKMWETFSRAQTGTADRLLFVEHFRRFLIAGADAQVGRAAGLAYAQSGRAEFATADQINTPAFKAWFRDSKVVDAEGKPLVVYHGTNAKWDAYDLGKNKNQWWGEGIYLTESPERARLYGDRVLALYARITEDGDGYRFTKDGKPTRDWLAKSPEQIKSATGNRGTFDPEDARIDFATGQDDKPARHAALDAERQQVKTQLRQLENGLGDPKREAELRAQLAATEEEFAALDREVRPQAYTPPATPEAVALRERYEVRRDAFDRTSAEADAMRAELNALLTTEEAADFARVRALRDQVREADAATRRLYDELVQLRAEIDRAQPSRAKLPDGKTAQQVMDDLLRVEQMPGPPRRDALIAEWRYGRQLEAEGRRGGNAPAQAEGRRLMEQAKARLDDEFPGWQQAKEQAKPTPPPPAPEPAGLDDAEKSPFAEPPRDLPVRPGQTANVYGHSAHSPSWLMKQWDRLRGMLRGWRGAVPELPAFPDATWNRSDPFIQREGPRFYDRMKAFGRALRVQTDFVQATAAEQVGQVTQPLLAIGGKLDARGYARLAELQARARKAKAEAKPFPAPLAAELAALQSRLEAHPYVLFERLVLMLDLRWRGQNLQDSAGKPILLPSGINAAEIEAELARLAQKIEASPHAAAIRTAAEAHRQLVKRVADDLASRELLAADALRNPWYFPHLTLQTTRDGKVTERELSPAKVKPGTEADFRGYLIDPTGSVKPIETDYVRAMYFHLVQVGAHNAKADAVRFYARPYDVMAGVRETAQRLSRERGQTVSWEQAFHEVYAPQGFTLYGADSGDAFSQVTVDRDRLAQRLGVLLTGDDLHKQLAELGQRGIRLLPEDLRETLVQGQRETWVVPARVAEALRGIADRADAKPGLIDAVLKNAVGAWKAWKLFMPHNHVRYEYGNLVADLEKLFSAAPGTFRQMPQAARELRAFWLGGQPSDLLRAALKEGVINAITAQEMNQLRSSPLFRQFETGGEKAWAEFKAWASAPLANLTRLKDGGLLGRVTSVEESAFREGMFRYAKFLADYKALVAGARPEYAGAAFREIDAMGDSAPGAGDAKVRKAAAISKSTFGDYGDLSVTGQALRDKLIPFYSWMEVNIRYHANLLRNLRDMVRAEEMSRAEAAKAGTRAAAVFAAGFSARAAGGIALRLALPYAAVMLWNATGDRDELEKLLSDEDRRRFHIIIGTVDDDAEAIDGTQIVKLRDGRRVRVAYANTALMDVLKWVSGAAFAQQMGRWLNGKTDFATAAAAWRDQIGPDIVNNLVGSVGPMAKVPYAVLAKKSTFPDVFDQRTIPAYDMRRAVLAQITDEFTADLIERAVNRDFYASKDLGTWAAQLILQVRERDPEAWAFYAMKDKAETFRERATGTKREGGSYDAPEQQALRNFRRAIYRGDVEGATQFYLRLLDYGYTAERFAAGIRTQDPLATLPKENGLRRMFVESLDATDREMLDRAYAYYTRLSSSRGREAMLFPREATGQRGMERYRQSPPVDGLRRLVELSANITDEDRQTRALFEERRSLQRR